MDNVILAKVETVERCLKRVHTESSKNWKDDFTVQDALLLNIERACQATIDCASHIVAKRKLGLPKQSKDIFLLMLKDGMIDQALTDSLVNMVGFRNLSVHDYASLNLDIVESIISNELHAFKSFCKIVISLSDS